VEQHQASSTSNDAVARLMGFATVAQRRKQHARAHMLLANWLAESGQGYHGDILSTLRECCSPRLLRRAVVKGIGC
jgi:hypothetical protein